jgi:hypothetical protein
VRLPARGRDVDESYISYIGSTEEGIEECRANLQCYEDVTVEVLPWDLKPSEDHMKQQL